MKKGFIVVECGNEFEQVLCLEKGENIPVNGILCWPNEGFERHVFVNKKQARAAINRTYYYARAFEYTNMPDKNNCKIQPVALPEI